MILTILQHTPAWVWALLAGLLVLGGQQSRDRAVSPLRLVMLPLALMALGVSSLLGSLHLHPWSAALWLLAIGLAAWAGSRWLVPAGARWDAATQRLLVPGSLLPMALILVIFGFKYTLGVYGALAPAAVSAPGFVAGVAVCSGLFSGLLAGRTAGLLGRTRPHTIAAHAHRA